MQTKLTLRMEDAVIRKAKRLARKRGKSVSALFSDYITGEPEPLPAEALPPRTAAMLGILGRGSKDLDEQAYGRHLEEKHL